MNLKMQCLFKVMEEEGGEANKSEDMPHTQDRPVKHQESNSGQ